MRRYPILFLAFVLYSTLPLPSPLPVSGRKTVPGAARSGFGRGSKNYAVVFDAGSSGSRVHVFCFDEDLNLLHIGDEFEVFMQVKPGLSAYAKDPQMAANSLVPLLEKAVSVVPEELRSATPVRLGATAGLRNLGTETSEKILQAVRNLLQNSSLEFKSDWVAVLDGTQEGAYEWITINCLLGNLRSAYWETVGAVDLGGGSVQMAYAISESAAANSPTVPDGEEPYVKPLRLKGSNYYLYVHSYLKYGLLAARAEVLKSGGESYSYCILGDYHGSYKYGDMVYQASASPTGPSYGKCKNDVLTALKINETCRYSNCTFGGVWNGGDGAGVKNLYVASFFFDRASQAGFVDPDTAVAQVTPANFLEAAEFACKLNVEEAKHIYSLVADDDLPYLCMDLVYEFTLLVDGFGLDPWQQFTLVHQVPYRNSLVEAAWPLGSAIELLSSEQSSVI